MLCLRGYFATPSHPRLFLHPQKLSACPSSEGKRALATGSAFDSLQEGVGSTSNLSRLWRRLPRRGGFSLPATGGRVARRRASRKGNRRAPCAYLVRTNAVVSPLASGVRRGSDRVQAKLLRGSIDPLASVWAPVIDVSLAIEERAMLLLQPDVATASC